MKKRVDVQFRGSMSMAQSKVQELKMQMSRQRGVVSIDLLTETITAQARDIDFPDEATRREWVANKFEEEWDIILRQMRSEIGSGSQQADLWDSTAAAYREFAKLPRCICDDRDTEIELKDNLSAANQLALQSGDLDDLKTEETIGGKLKSRLFIKQSYLKPAMNKSLTECLQSESALRKLWESDRYISLFSFCDGWAERRVIYFDAGRHILWDTVYDNFLKMAESSGSVYRLRRFFDQFKLMLIEFTPDFRKAMSDAMELYLANRRTSAVKEVCKEYQAFGQGGTKKTVTAPEKYLLSSLPVFESSGFVDTSDLIRYERIKVCEGGPRDMSRKWHGVPTHFLQGGSDISFDLELCETKDINGRKRSEVQRAIFGGKADPKLLWEVADRFVRPHLDWDGVLRDVCQAVDSCLRSPTGEQSSRRRVQFSTHLIQNIYKDVEAILCKKLTPALELMGVALDMDGKGFFHTFALLHTWRSLTAARLVQQNQHIVRFCDEKSKWGKYVADMVCADPTDKTRTAAVRFAGDFLSERKRAAADIFGLMASVRLRTVQDMFSAKTIQKRLDEELLFCEEADSGMAVRRKHSNYFFRSCKYLTSPEV